MADTIKFSKPEAGEEIVISGMAGRFPSCDSIDEFQDKLFNKVNMVSTHESRWRVKNPDIPPYSGKIKDLNSFDAEFFGINYDQAHHMDPTARIIMETTFEAIIDAGYNPNYFKGKNMGVFVASCIMETEEQVLYKQHNPLGVTGCLRNVFVSRISDWLDIHGPSVALDSACSSTFTALHQAYTAIATGICDCALVGASHLVLEPFITIHFNKMGVLSKNGLCSTFDDRSKGYTRSEAIGVIILQKAKDARRAYAQLKYTMVNCDGYKESGITFPSSEMQKNLLKHCYETVDVDPAQVEFVECHGTGTYVGDPQEVNAIDQVFCKNRKEPLKIGAVKSNIGHAEASAGLVQLVKVCIAYHTSYIAPNLNYEIPNSRIPALVEGRVRVVTEKTPFNLGTVGISGFGFGGANGHAVLQNASREKLDGDFPADDLPRLVCFSTRTEMGMKRALDHLASSPVDVEQIKMINDVFEEDIPKCLFRGCAVLRPRGSDVIAYQKSRFHVNSRKPIWFVFTDIQSYWSGMAKDLMRVKIFADSIAECCEILNSKAINLVEIVSSGDHVNYENNINCCTGVTAVQIALIDLLNAVGVKPDYMIGYGIGELACAYADKCLTKEQAMLISYYQGLVSDKTLVYVEGIMVRVGLSHEEFANICPPQITIVSHESPNSCVVSGPVNIVQDFMERLQYRGVRVEHMLYGNLPMKSKYMLYAGKMLKAKLKQIMIEPKLRSSKWISTQGNANEEELQYSSLNYYLNNFLNPVLFQETIEQMPDDVIVLELGPDCIHSSLLKSFERSHIDLMNRENKGSVEYLMESLGRLYILGINMKLALIHPPVEYPVSRGTPRLEKFIDWDHTEKWFVSAYYTEYEKNVREKIVKVDMADDCNAYIKGHIVDGRNLYPATGYLHLVWESLGTMISRYNKYYSVKFSNVSFMRATNAPENGTIEFLVTIERGTGNFEIIEGDTTIVKGNIVTIEPQEETKTPINSYQESSEDILMTTADVYKELNLRGYNYRDFFQGIKWCNTSSTKACVEWRDNWVTFLDNTLQITLLTKDSRGLFLPTYIETLTIDYQKHMDLLAKLPLDQKTSAKYVTVERDPHTNTIRCGGMEMKGLNGTSIKKRSSSGDPILESYAFVPNVSTNVMKISNALGINLQLLLENERSHNIKCVELLDSFAELEAEPLMPIVEDICGKIPLIQPEMIVITDNKQLDLGATITIGDQTSMKDANIFMGSKLLERPETMNKILKAIKEKSFVLTREMLSTKLRDHYENFDVITVMFTEKELLVMLRKAIPSTVDQFSVVEIKEMDEEFTWLEEVMAAVKMQKKTYLVSQNDFNSGILGLYNCLKRELPADLVKCVYIADAGTPVFDPSIDFYKNQLEKNLDVNVLKNGAWGTYRHIVLNDQKMEPVTHAYCNILNKGDLSTLAMLQGDIINPDDENIVHIYYAGLNYRDVLIATGYIETDVQDISKNDQNSVIGFEYVGKLNNGTRIMGCTNKQAIANMIKIEDYFWYPIPDRWSMEEAATIMIAYSTAYYSLISKAKLKKGESVLIHSGSGGVGQAAINVCLYYGCKIFTTVGTEEKKRFLMNLYPQILESHIGFTRDTSFEVMINRETEGKGVDIVLNSLREEKLLASLRCLGQNGRFVEIGKYDMLKNTSIGMKFMHKNISIYPVEMDKTILSEDQRYRYEAFNLIKDGIEKGCIKPLTRTVFNFNEIENAFRYMSKGKHVGKVVIKLRDETPDLYSKPVHKQILAYPQFEAHAEKSYVIIGGLGGFGLELADWLILHGAKNILLNSRRGVCKGYQSYRIRFWRLSGVNVLVSTDDATTSEGCMKILNSANRMGQVSGIFNLAVVLRDATFENQTVKNFKEVFACKVAATKHLDRLSRTACPKLEYFVVFSSVVCGRGNEGQTNYGMANSVMERICENRKLQGLPALAIEWGAIGDVGMVAETLNMDAEIGGTLRQGIANCLEVMHRLLGQNDSAVVCSMCVASKAQCCGKTLVDSVASVLNIKDLKSVSMNFSLTDLGMDSIMAVEIKQIFERDFNLFLTTGEIRLLTFARIQEMSDEHNSGEASDQTINIEVNETKQHTAHLEIIFRNFCEEEVSSEPFVRMIQNDDDSKNDTGNPMIMIPGIEGTVNAFNQLNDRLKCDALCLQICYDDVHKRVSGTADRFVDIIKQNVNRHEMCTIVAYSYGTLIALEVLKILEDEGYQCQAVFVDGSPSFLKQLIASLFEVQNGSSFERELLMHVSRVISPNRTEEVKTAIEDQPDFAAMCSAAVGHLSVHNLKHSADYLTRMLTSINERIKNIVDYEGGIERKLRSRAVLLRTSTSPPRVLATEDYDLGDYFAGPLEVHLLEGNHITILEDEKCARAINEMAAKGRQC